MSHTCNEDRTHLNKVQTPVANKPKNKYILTDLAEKSRHIKTK